MIEFRVREMCKRCKGNRIAQHPLWEEFWKQVKSGRLAQEDYEAWFEKHGYSPDRIPSEEIPCPACNGTGYTERWASLGEVRALTE